MTNTPRKVLIIKTGYTETLCNEPYKQGNVSLGDVLRTTAILHLYSKDNVTWLTDPKAVPLLERNPYIKRILEFSLSAIMQLQNETYDIVINLEKNPGVCALAQSINSWQKYGFRFDRETGQAEAYTESIDALYISRYEEHKRRNDLSWLEHLYEMLGQVWDGEGYVLVKGKGATETPRMIGLNFMIGDKFKEKGWSTNNWNILANLLEDCGFTITFQPHETTLDTYMNWIHSCSGIVSCDSLGLHIAMAYSKRVVGLFGPTLSKEIHPYANGTMIQARSMNLINPESVCEKVKEVYSWGLC